MPDYRLAVTYPDGDGGGLRRVVDRRPVPVPAHAGRDGPAPDRRGPARGAVAGARRARPQLRRGRPARRSRCGRRTPAASGSSATSTTGTAARTRCGPWAAPGSGSCSCPAWQTGTRYKFDICGPDGPWRRKADPMASLAERPPATASVVFDVQLRVGATRTGWPRRAEADPLREPMSVYEVHLGSWRPGLSYLELADAADRLRDRDWASPTWSSCRWPSTRSAGPGATRSPPTTRRPPGSAPRTSSATWSTGCTRPGIGVILDWVPAHFPRDELGAGPVRRHRRCTSTPTRAAASTRTGARSSSTTAATEVRNFLVANALYWLEEFHVDGLRVDAVASMLYLDYSRKAGEWLPNAHGGRENLDAVSFLQEVNATCYRRVPGRHDDRRGVHRLAGRDPAGAPGRARLRLQVEHGLDARHAELPVAGPGVPAATTTTR